MLKPTSIDDLQQAVRDNQLLQPVAGRSKPALSTHFGNAALLDMTGLSGIIEYEPDEYTFTAYAGTAVSDIAAVLAQNGQYLPFDPLFAHEGATLGGTVAANLSGSGRYRYGGVRDFILGLKFVDGAGKLVQGGGKVVKNSAGFDIPKFMVGSLGRYGIFATLTFKVFPQPRSYRTLLLDYDSLTDALSAIYALATAPFEMDALDIEPEQNGRFRLVIRLGGLPNALPGRIERLQAFLQEKTTILQTSQLDQDDGYWRGQNSLLWGIESTHLVKIPLAPKQIPALDATLTGQRRYTSGGNLAWVATNDVTTLDNSLAEQGLVGLTLRGLGKRPYLGQRKGVALARRVKQALDPHGKFIKDE